MVQRRTGIVRDARGTALIEFSILTPIFLLMLTGMLAYGIYFGAAHALQQLAADAARTAVAGVTASERDQLVADYLVRNAGAYFLINPARLNYQVGESAQDPNQYRVQLTYDATELPIWNLYPPLPLPSRQISSGATIRRGGI